MKKCTQFIVLFFLLAIFSCASSKVNKYGLTRDNPFKILDSTELAKENRFYSIKKPKNWYAFVEPHGGLYYAPEKLKNQAPINFKSFVGFALKENKKNKLKNINDYVNASIKKLKKTYKNFNYQQIETKHEKYGKSIVLRFISSSWNDKNIKYKTANLYLFYKNKCYLIRYRSTLDNFDEFVPDVEKMIKSFKIKE
ncbi:hypothetical protein MC378_05715 [Polaribacter sp. MSW13]|uniref:Lipoprotein n=1 Tax=Polaribacter marinus TaxID=2916838 RepID=A0A9X2AIM3_9FLAO|nr:hypothetical protein [Polaribacter marinus]MCI2228656.1 hypothetical protein [Polaribacter marinus]